MSEEQTQGIELVVKADAPEALLPPGLLVKKLQRERDELRAELERILDLVAAIENEGVTECGQLYVLIMRDEWNALATEIGCDLPPVEPWPPSREVTT